VQFVALTPNLAIDRTLRVERPVDAGTLHRITAVHEAAGGKGVNVARVLSALGSPVTVAGFLGGFNGQKFRHLLAADGLTGAFHEVVGETRECQIVLGDDPHPTEFNEPGPIVTKADWRLLVAGLPPMGARQFVVAGSLPTGLSPGEYADLLAELPGPVVVDTSGAALAAAVRAKPALIAPNRAELQALVPHTGDPLAAARAVYEEHGVPVLLTLGAAGAAYVGESVHQVPAPRVETVNPVGSGDALLAAFLYARATGWEAPAALRLGVAAGAENAAAGGGARVTRAAIFARYQA